MSSARRTLRAFARRAIVSAVAIACATAVAGSCAIEAAAKPAHSARGHRAGAGGAKQRGKCSRRKTARPARGRGRARHCARAAMYGRRHRGAASRPGSSRPAPKPPVAKPPATTPPVVRPPAGGVPRLFAADSFWNAPLANAAPLDASSPARMSAFVRQIKSEITQGIGPWISESEYSTPLYTVGPNQPRVGVKLDTGPWGDPLRAALRDGVPIPADARQAKGSDGHMTIYQPSSDTLWEFWQASKQADGWHASWGGAMRNVSSSPGYYTSSAWPGLAPSDGWNWGSTASSLPVIGGTITIADLKSGHIDHALALDIPAPCASTFTWPAQRTDGTSKSPDCLPEGARLRLDPALDLSKLGLPPFTRMLAEAAQRYGMVVRDKTGHATGFYAEDPSPTGTEPYWGADGFYGGLKPWNFLPPFPWAHLRLLRMNTCSAAPCRRPG